jgi:hypothetical protein
LIFNSANCLGYYRMFITSAAKRLSIWIQMLLKTLLLKKGRYESMKGRLIWFVRTLLLLGGRSGTETTRLAKYLQCQMWYVIIYQCITSPGIVSLGISEFEFELAPGGWNGCKYPCFGGAQCMINTLNRRCDCALWHLGWFSWERREVAVNSQLQCPIVPCLLPHFWS